MCFVGCRDRARLVPGFGAVALACCALVPLALGCSGTLVRAGEDGGAIYNDGNTYTLTICGTRITNNHAREGGGAIFFVSNDRTGTLTIRDSFLSQNPSDGFETAGYPGIFVLASGDPQVTNSTIE